VGPELFDPFGHEGPPNIAVDRIISRQILDRTAAWPTCRRWRHRRVRRPDGGGRSRDELL